MTIVFCFAFASAAITFTGADPRFDFAIEHDADATAELPACVKKLRSDRRDPCPNAYPNASCAAAHVPDARINSFNILESTP